MILKHIVSVISILPALYKEQNNRRQEWNGRNCRELYVSKLKQVRGAECRWLVDTVLFFKKIKTSCQFREKYISKTKGINYAFADKCFSHTSSFSHNFKRFQARLLWSEILEIFGLVFYLEARWIIKAPCFAFWRSTLSHLVPNHRFKCRLLRIMSTPDPLPKVISSSTTAHGAQKNCCRL